MTEENNSPFQPGALIAIYRYSTWGDPSIRKAEIAKVRKNGNFTIQQVGKPETASADQWKPMLQHTSGEPRRWIANHRTDVYNRETASLWSAEVDADIAQAGARREIRQKLKEAQTMLSELGERSPENHPVILAIHDLLTTLKEKKDAEHAVWKAEFDAKNAAR